MKTIKVVLVTLILFSFFGCKKIDKYDPDREGVNASEVSSLIDDLVGKEINEKKIEVVRSYYENLDDKEKLKVGNIEVLIDLEYQIIAKKYDAAFEVLLRSKEDVDLLLEKHYIMVDKYLLYPLGITKYIKTFEALKENIDTIIYKDVSTYLDSLNPNYLIDKLPFPKYIKDYGIELKYELSNQFLLSGIYLSPTDKDEEVSITAKYIKNGIEKSYQLKEKSVVLEQKYALPLNDFLSQFSFPLEKNYETICLKCSSTPDAVISFKSLNTEIFSDKGILRRPDHDTFIIFEITIAFPDENEQRTINYKARVNGNISNEPYEFVIDAINNIPNNVSLDDEDDINIALDMYLNLNTDDKKLVKNYQELLDALDTIQILKDQLVAKEIDDLIEALPAEVQEEDKEIIQEARELYDALTDNQKAFVTKLPTLEEKEAIINSYAQNSEIVIKISLLPQNISLEFEEEILEIKKEIDLLNEETLKAVSNYNKYLELYFDYQELKINKYIEEVVPKYFFDEYSFPVVDPYFGIKLEFIPSNSSLLSDGWVWHQLNEEQVDILVKYEINSDIKEKTVSSLVLSEKYAYTVLDFIGQFKQPLARNYEEINFISSTYKEAIITFDSLNKDIFSNEGTLVRPGKDCTIALRVTVEFPDEDTRTIDVDLNVRGLLIHEIAQIVESQYLNYLGDNGTINGDLVLPSEDLFYNLNLEWLSGDESIITSDGKYINPGIDATQTTIYLKLIDKNNQYNTITIQYTVLIVGEEYTDIWDAIDYFLNSIHNDHITNQSFTLYGSEPGYIYVPSYNVGYLPFYSKDDLKIIQSIVAAPNNLVRSQKERPLTRYITVHNTGMAAPSATAKGLDTFIRTKTAQSSWHFSLDDKEAYQQLPLNEIGWHAGDGTSRVFEDIPTNVRFDGDYYPKVKITTDGYYSLNDVKSSVEAPRGSNGEILTTSHIIDTGLVVNVINGFYYMTPSWFQTGYKKICNYGGNIASVGIESCVYEGVDFNMVMRNLGKLISTLLLEYNLGLNAVKQHYDFAAKDCPQVIRSANRWDELLNLIKIEMFAKLYLKDVDFTFVSLNPTIMDDTGKVINHPGNKSVVNYKVLVTYDNITKQYDYSSILDALSFKKI